MTLPTDILSTTHPANPDKPNGEGVRVSASRRAAAENQDGLRYGKGYISDSHVQLTGQDSASFASYIPRTISSYTSRDVDAALPAPLVSATSFIELL